MGQVGDLGIDRVSEERVQGAFEPENQPDGAGCHLSQSS